MKPSNAQIRELKQFRIRYSSSTTFEQAAKLINDAKLDHIEKLRHNIRSNGDLNGSSWFSRWIKNE